MRSKLLLLALGTGICLAACQNKNTADVPVTTMDTTSHTGDNNNSGVASGDAGQAKMEDSSFLAKANQTGLFEIEAGNLAEKKSQNAEVKSFAKMMIDQHTAMGKDVGDVAMAKGITLPTTMSEDDRKEFDKLNALTGAKFDKEYISANVKGHREAIDLFDKTSKNTADSKEVQNLAADGLPKLKLHQDHAKTLDDKLK